MFGQKTIVYSITAAMTLFEDESLWIQRISWSTYKWYNIL